MVASIIEDLLNQTKFLRQFLKKDYHNKNLINFHKLTRIFRNLRKI